MTKCLWGIVVLLGILMGTEVLGIGITPGGMEIGYAPGNVVTYPYTITGVDGKVKITASGDLGVNVSVSESEYYADGTPHTITVSFVVPELPPGKHRMLVTASQAPDKKYGQSQITALAAVAAWIDAFVPYPDIYAEISKFEHDLKVKLGEVAYFKVVLRNLGSKPIPLATGTVEITDNNGIKIITVPLTNALDIPLEGAKEMYAEWDIKDVSPGTYNAKGLVVYGDKTDETDINYILVGEVQLDIINLTPQKGPVDKIFPVSIFVNSVWNEEISYYVDLLIKEPDTETVLKKVTSPTLKILPWQTAATELFINPSGLSEKSYDAEVILYYEGKESKKTYEMNLTREETAEGSALVLKKEGSTFLTSPLVWVALIVLLAIGVIVFWYFKRGNEEKKDRGSEQF